MGPLREEHHHGATEPWVATLVAEIVRCKRARVVLETGGFTGSTSVEIAAAMQLTGGGHLRVVEIDLQRATDVHARLIRAGYPDVTHLVDNRHALTAISDIPDGTLEVAFIDDDHTAAHVEAEIMILKRKMAPGGIMLFHDVVGPFGLGDVVRKHGGVVLDFPRLHAAGGLGIISL